MRVMPHSSSKLFQSLLFAGSAGMGATTLKMLGWMWNYSATLPLHRCCLMARSGTQQRKEALQRQHNKLERLQQAGVDAKLKRYPPRGGKCVIACSVETWGYMHSDLDHLLGELAVLASQKQRDVGQHPSRWLASWRTDISVQIVINVG